MIVWYTQNSELLTEARKAKAFRDEADAMRESAERADRLDLEVQRYRERLADAEFYKVRVDELREDNKVLLDTRGKSKFLFELLCILIRFYVTIK